MKDAADNAFDDIVDYDYDFKAMRDRLYTAYLLKPQDGIETSYQKQAKCDTTRAMFYMEANMAHGPDKDSIFPNSALREICFIKNTITRPNVIVGDYTYYDDKNGADKFQDHVTHHYEWIGDRLIIGKFCQIAQGIEFVMNGANHCMKCATTYPFYIMGNGWDDYAPAEGDMPFKGDTVVGNDVWIGQNVTVMPGVHIGDGAIIGASSVVASNIGAYCVAVGNPCRVVHKRFSDEVIAHLERIQWWNWSIEKINDNMGVLCGREVEKIMEMG